MCATVAAIHRETDIDRHRKRIRCAAAALGNYVPRECSELARARERERADMLTRLSTLAVVIVLAITTTVIISGDDDH